MMDMTPPRATATLDRVALLVDAENLSATLAPRILCRAEVLGPVALRRAYGKAAHVAEWENHGFRLIPASAAKNSADLALCVDAMTLALREAFPTLVIASSDRDFSPLALQLRELGFQVVGMGGEKAPQALRRACSQFVQLDPPADPSPSAPEKAASPVTHPPLNAQVDRAAVAICRALSADGKPVSLSTVGHHLARQGFTSAKVGRAKWSSYFKSHPGFRLSEDGKTCLLRPL